MHECSLAISITILEMIQKAILFASSILNFVGSPLFRPINHHLIKLQQIYSKIKWFLCNGSSAHLLIKDCKSCKKQIPPEGVLTVDEIEMVVEKLGMGGFWKEIDGECRECGLLEGVSLLLEEKEASLEELKKAFAVFDKNGDGFISVVELQEVMGRLELAEGMELEDCEKMIRAFNGNGDGRIDFCEFKDMLEHVN